MHIETTITRLWLTTFAAACNNAMLCYAVVVSYYAYKGRASTNQKSYLFNKLHRVMSYTGVPMNDIRMTSYICIYYKHYNITYIIYYINITCVCYIVLFNIYIYMQDVMCISFIGTTVYDITL